MPSSSSDQQPDIGSDEVATALLSTYGGGGAPATVAAMAKQVANLSPTLPKDPLTPATRSRGPPPGVAARPETRSQTAAMNPPNAPRRAKNPPPTSSQVRHRDQGSGSSQPPRATLASILTPRNSGPLPSAPVVAAEVSERVDRLSTHSSQVTDDIAALQAHNQNLQLEIDNLHVNQGALVAEITSLKKTVTTLANQSNQRSKVGTRGIGPGSSDESDSSRLGGQGPRGPASITSHPLELAAKRAPAGDPDIEMGGVPSWRRKNLG